jgi:hypothetical protein
MPCVNLFHAWKDVTSEPTEVCSSNVNVQEKVQTLEALLSRVKKNASIPRAARSADASAPHAGIVAVGEIAPIPPAPDVLAVKPAVVEAKPAVAKTAAPPTTAGGPEPKAAEAAQPAARATAPRGIVPPPPPRSERGAPAKTAEKAPPASARKPAEKAPPVSTRKPAEKVEAGKPTPARTMVGMPKLEAPIFAAKPAEKVEALQEDLAKRGVPQGATGIDDELSSEDTQLMVASNQDGERRPRAAAPTFDDDANMVTSPRHEEAPARAQAPLLQLEEPEAVDEEATQLLPSSKRRTEQAPVSARNVATAEAAEDSSNVVLGATGIPSQPEASPAIGEKLAPDLVAAKIVEAAPAPIQPSTEVTIPSRRYAESTPTEAAPRPTRSRRTAAIVIGLVAAVLIGAGVFIGLSNGWLGFSVTPRTKPTVTNPSIEAPPSAETGAAVAPPPETVPPPMADTAAATTPPVVGGASAAPSVSARPSAAASAAPPPSASAAPQPSASAAPTAQAEGASLPPNRGYLIVTSTTPANVYLNGVLAGPTGQNLEVDCGAKFIRLGPVIAEGAPKPAFITWLSEGRSVKILCRSVTSITLDTKP